MYWGIVKYCNVQQLHVSDYITTTRWTNNDKRLNLYDTKLRAGRSQIISNKQCADLLVLNCEERINDVNG